MKISGEDRLVRRIARALGYERKRGSRGLELGIGDDTALFAPSSGYETILTSDWFLEGTHFLRDLHPADAVGWKCLARALSDIAAMGGTPRCFLMSLAVPSSHTGRWLNEFLGGLKRASRQFGCTAAGGDTTERKEILINVMVVGEVRAGAAVLRAGAKPGDLIFVSGRLGEAAVGLKLLREKGKRGDRTNPLLRKHLYPEPRLALGQWLAKRGIISAMMDISDGLSSDLPRLCAASGVGARIEEEKLPTADDARAGRNEALGMALDGGDDYELLFTVPKRIADRVPRSVGGLRLTPIGQVTRLKKIMLAPKNGRTEILAPHGWDPFR